MKTRLRQVLALIMAAVMTFSAFPFSSFAAAPDEFDDIQTITTESFDVTILRDSHSMYYKFVPTKTAFYYVYTEGVSDTWLTLYDDTLNEIKQIRFMEYEGGCSDSMLYLAAGSTYYIKVSAYSESYPITLTVGLQHLGMLDNAEITWLPDKLTYISGYDTSWFDLHGMRMSLTFSGGSVFYLFDYDINNMFDVTCPVEHISTNTATLSIMGQYIVSFEYEVIENPVSSIEVVQSPYKEYYRYARDGWFFLDGWFYGWFEPDIDTEGLKVKINYTDGTSKTVEFDEEDDGDGMYVDGYYMEVYTNGDCGIGDNDVTINYLEHEASFTIKVADISLFEKLFVYTTRIIARILESVF